MKIKISELEGAALDWAVGRALGAEVKDHQFCATPGSHVHKNCTVFPSGHAYTHWRPSTDWGHGGRLIDNFGIWFEPRHGQVMAWGNFRGHQLGPTRLVAAMRAIVAAHAGGDTVEVPTELVEDVKQDGDEQWQPGGS